MAPPFLRIVLIAATVAALAVVAIALVVDPGRGSHVGSGADQPKTVAGARAAAQATFDLYTAGDYGAFWDSWSAASQGLVSRDNYLRLFELCKPIAQGVRFQVAEVTVRGDRANVAVTRIMASLVYQFQYEEGRWRYIPDQQTQADYRSKTVERIAAERQAAKTCAT